MTALYQLLSKLCLIIYVVSLEVNFLHCCLSEPDSTVFPRQFKFEALPSGKVSLGDKVELRCTVNGTTQLTSIALLSRMRAQLNTKCVITSHAGFCSYTIESVQLWDIGKYDCIKIYSDGSCYTMTLAVRRTDDKRTVITIAPRMAPTIVTKNTREPSVMKFVNKSSEIEIVKLITTSSETTAHVNNGVSLTSLPWKHVVLMLPAFLTTLILMLC